VLNYNNNSLTKNIYIESASAEMMDNIFGKERESVWVGLDRKLRKLMFAILHEILQANRVSPLIYKLLLLIEGI